MLDCHLQYNLNSTNPFILPHQKLKISYLMQQWIDLAQSTGLQARKSDPPPSFETLDPPTPAALGCNTTEDASTDEINSQ